MADDNNLCTELNLSLTQLLRGDQRQSSYSCDKLLSTAAQTTNDQPPSTADRKSTKQWRRGQMFDGSDFKTGSKPVTASLSGKTWRKPRKKATKLSAFVSRAPQAAGSAFNIKSILSNPENRKVDYRETKARLHAPME